ncbi:MAG: RNA-binding domain-containing protein [Elusimicrobiota bacterium]
MKKETIEKIIGKGESETLELKPSLSQINEIVETISAFANTVGGKIIIGVSDSGKIKGVEIGKGTIENLTNTIAQNTEPKIQPHITVEKTKGKNIIVVDVPESMDKLVLAYGRPYKRVGKSSPRMSKEEYEKRILEKHKEKLQFDTQICKNTSLEDIDWNFIKETFIPLYEKVSEKRITGKSKSLLDSLNCTRDNKPTNAGILLFGKEPQKFYLNSYIALARYKGKTEGFERLDYKEFRGNLIQQIDNCDKYIKEHITVMSRSLPHKVEREDIPEYGWFTIRELITNAVCHRDYSQEGSKVIIKMFDDHIEYYNPGGLPVGITPQNITEKQFSRNSIIANVLAKIRYIEELGEGWNKITDEYKTHPLKPKMPKIVADEFSILVILFSPREKFGKGSSDLNERQKKAIDYIRRKGKITNSEYQKINRTTKKTATRDIQNLVRREILIRYGRTGKGVYYTLNLIYKGT